MVKTVREGVKIVREKIVESFELNHGFSTDVSYISLDS